MSVIDSARGIGPAPTPRPDRRPLVIGVGLLVLAALLIGAVVGGRAAWRWWQLEPLAFDGTYGGGTITVVQIPHLDQSFWLVDAPKGTVETVEIQMGNGGSRPLTLDHIVPLFGPYEPGTSDGGVAVRVQRVDEHLVPQGPVRAAAGFTIEPGALVQLYLPVRALGCDSTAPGGETGGATMSTQQLTVMYHRLGRARSQTLQLPQQVVIAYDGNTENGDHYSCVLPPG